MTKGIVLALLAATLYGVLGVAFELAAKREYPKWDFMMYKQLCGTLLGLAMVLVLRVPLIEPHILVLALVGAVAYLATLWAYLTASRERDIAANWTILNLSVVVPVCLSIFYFHDAFSYSKGVGFGFTVLAILLIGGLGAKKVDFSRGWVRWIAVAFLLNGWFVILLRFVPAKLGALFTFYFYGLSAIITILYKVIVRENFSRQKGIYWVAALGAVTHCSGIMLTIVALYVVGQVSAQAGLIVYPITNGLPIVTGVVIGSFVLRQMVTTREKWGIACGVVAMALLSWG
jgi:drug/metabolite transporter (DMT)-like permease